MTAQAPGDGTRRRTTKLGIVGAGAVGATWRTPPDAWRRRNVALFDVNAAKVHAEALDLSHGIQFVPMAHVSGSDDIEVLADSDVIVFTAGAKQRPGQSRLDLAESTIGIMPAVCPDSSRSPPTPSTSSSPTRSTS